MTSIPKPLQKGDHIRIVAPAKRIEEQQVLLAKKILEESDFVVSVSENCLGGNHYFSGTTQARLLDFQEALNDADVDAILCARGGYGCIQIVDDLDWSLFQKSPKWIIGFSDVTVLHNRIRKLGAASIHGTMPLNFVSHTKASFQTLLNSTSGKEYTIKSPASTYNQNGKAIGKITGGNLAIISSLLGTNDQPDYLGCILFVEEVGEPLYSIDRMFYSLKKAGVLNQISGLIVGGMTSMKDSEIPYGKSVEEIIVNHTKELNIPVAFDFPAGHIDDNQSIILGVQVTFTITESGGSIVFPARG